MAAASAKKKRITSFFLNLVGYMATDKNNDKGAVVIQEQPFYDEDIQIVTDQGENSTTKSLNNHQNFCHE